MSTYYKYKIWSFINLFCFPLLAIAGAIFRLPFLALGGLILSMVAGYVIWMFRCPVCRKRFWFDYRTILGVELKVVPLKLWRQCPHCNFDIESMDKEFPNLIDKDVLAESDICLSCGQLIPPDSSNCYHCGWTWDENATME